MLFIYPSQLAHPYIIDTSVIYNLTGNRKRKSKLATLMEYFLGETIQEGRKGHSPSEDARAAMKLVQLKLSKGFDYGDSITAEEGSASIAQCQLITSVFNNSVKASKTVAVIGKKKDLEHYQRFKLLDDCIERNASSYKAIPVTSAKEAVSQLENSAVNHNFTLAHIDLTKKLGKCSTQEEREKVYQKLDTWCSRVFNYVSLNGLCVIVFAGKTHKLGSSSASEVNNSGTEQTNGKSREDKRRYSGAAFIRVKTAKFK